MNIQEFAAHELLGPLNEVEIKNAPSHIYAAGDPLILRMGPRVSLVGSRKASPLGLAEARTLGERLAERSVVVVSGLAEGIDTAAYQGAMKAGGKCVAVLGTPLNEYFPASNKALQLRMMNEHLVLSQFPEGMPSQRGNFPRRNRTMALISDATIIIEAGDGSGSLHQGWEAIRLGRPLFLMEPLLRSNTLTWPREMEGYGARSLRVQDLDSLFDYLPVRTLGDASELAF